jgi:copper(I)-binding protein
MKFGGAFAFSFVLILVSCAGSDPVTVSDAWARSSPTGVTMGAAYFDITSVVNDSLLAVSVSSDIAARAEIHEVVKAMEMSDDASEMHDDEMHDDEMHDGAMSMQEMDALELPAGTLVQLVPGGNHVMLIDLAEPLVVGETFDLTLDFDQAPDLTVTVEVSDR